MRTWRKSDEKFSNSAMNEISNKNWEKLQETYNDVLGKDESFFSFLADDIKQMIPQIDQRIHYWEERRTQFLHLALGISAAATTGILILLPEVINTLINASGSTTTPNFFSVYFYMPFTIFFSSLIIGCTKMLILWNDQNNPPYPFTKGNKIWKWQYRHAENEPNTTDFKNFNNEILEEEAIIFAENSLNYKKRILCSSKYSLLDQDLSQLYLLLINEKFKIKFVSQSRDLFLKTITGSVIVLIISIFISIGWAIVNFLL